MGQWGWVLVSWAVVAGVVSLYAFSVLVRVRSLSKAVPEERRRWMS